MKTTIYKQINISKFSDEKPCPLCHGILINKIGRYGKFVGCSNFPKCNYIKKRKNKIKRKVRKFFLKVINGDLYINYLEEKKYKLLAKKGEKVRRSLLFR